MLSVDDALAICRPLAALAGDPALATAQVGEGTLTTLAQAVERLLVEVQLARDEAAHYREQLATWGIPAKRRVLKRLESGGFEAGWE